MARRLKAMGQPRYKKGFEVTLQPDVLELPLKWRLPRTVFVNSMSDLFHEEVPVDYIAKCFNTMRRASQHVFQVLTKRPERVVELASELEWTPNIWIGTSIESQPYVTRAQLLSDVPAAIRFLSLEPLLGPLKNLPLAQINWVIVGGESGPGARPMESGWVTSIRDDCLNAGVPFFFKQWGGVRKGRNGRALDGKEWNNMPGFTGRSNATRSVA
jgi:protein gp37